MPIIELKDVAKSFAGRKILSGINLAVEKGEFLAIIGPSGCGKTTLLKIIMGLIKPDRGEVFIYGKNVTRLNSNELTEYYRHLGMVFQSSALFDYLTVRENIAFALQRHTKMSETEINSRVKEVLAQVKLSDAENLMPNQLSGGMKKRVALARIIAYSPEVILYDEPTLSLDPANVEIIIDLIRQIHQKGDQTSLIVTHQIDAILLANRVVRLKDGQLDNLGKPQDLGAERLVKLFVNDSVKEAV
jgi:phospholipid/cholesterol/gamma-HCH transport system ATP-binding protein